MIHLGDGIGRIIFIGTNNQKRSDTTNWKGSFVTIFKLKILVGDLVKNKDSNTCV
jgi:hypothetical protein